MSRWPERIRPSGSGGPSACHEVRLADAVDLGDLVGDPEAQAIELVRQQLGQGLVGPVADGVRGHEALGEVVQVPIHPRMLALETESR